MALNIEQIIEDIKSATVVELSELVSAIEEEFGVSAAAPVAVAAAGGAAHLPGMVAASTTLPVIGVPIKSSTLNGVDSLLSIVQMPYGVPVATMAIGEAGAKNAAIIALSLIHI